MTDKAKVTDGANARAIDATIAGTGPGIPDEAATPGADRPEPPSDEEVGRVAKTLGAPVPEADD